MLLKMWKIMYNAYKMKQKHKIWIPGPQKLICNCAFHYILLPQINLRINTLPPRPPKCDGFWWCLVVDHFPYTDMVLGFIVVLQYGSYTH